MTNEELTKYLHWMNKEYGDRGWEGQGQMSLDDYGSQSLSGREGWNDILKDQLKYEQFGDQSPNYSFAEKDLPSNMGLLNSREDIEQVLRSRLVDNPDYPHIKPGQSPTSMMSTDGVPREPQLMSGPRNSGPVHAPQMQALESSSPIVPAVSSAPPALRTGAWTPAAGSMYGGEEALVAETAAEAGAESAWGGPAVFAGNMALNMIPTRDRQTVNTPLGDEGSYSGILKGGGKGALLGGTISGGNPYAIAGGAALGAFGGASGYFDSTSAPVVNISRVRRRGGGMPQGLLGGGSFYG